LIQNCPEYHLLGTYSQKHVLGSRRTGGSLKPKSGGICLYAKVAKDKLWPTGLFQNSNVLKHECQLINGLSISGLAQLTWMTILMTLIVTYSLGCMPGSPLVRKMSINTQDDYSCQAGSLQ
jgi:hypothetical protein